MIGKIMGYVWQVGLNLLTLFMLLIVLSSGNTRFEALTLSILALIYFTATSGFAASAYLQVEKDFTDWERFKSLRKLSDKKLSPDEEAGEEEAIAERDKAWNKAKTKFWITGGFNFIFYLIIIFKLFEVTLLN